jgi:hypothetical protein
MSTAPTEINYGSKYRYYIEFVDYAVPLKSILSKINFWLWITELQFNMNMNININRKRLPYLNAK